MRPFVKLLAARIKERHGNELSALVDETVDDAIESAAKASRDRLSKKTLSALGDRAIYRAVGGADFVPWLEDVMDKAGQEAGRGAFETIVLDSVYLEGEDPFVVSTRYIGDSQDPDTEVPTYLSHADLIRVLSTMGGKASCDWHIREVDAGWGRELRTIYSCRVTFPMKTLAIELFGQPTIEAAVDRAIAARSGAVKKTPAQFDREIAEALAARRGAAR